MWSIICGAVMLGMFACFLMWLMATISKEREAEYRRRTLRRLLKGLTG